MDFQSDSGTQSTDSGSNQKPSVGLDRETLRRIDHALEGTIEVDLSKLDPDDKLTLLIERYNRKMRELEEIKLQNQ